jgi:hypothetical protein
LRNADNRENSDDRQFTAIRVAATTTDASQNGPATQNKQARVGDTLTISGDGGERVDVTVDGVMDPLAVGSYDQADSGQRYVGVQITLKNSGSVPYSDAPSNGAALLSGNGEQATGEIVSGGPCGNDFQSSVNIAPGDSEQGCVPFEMEDGQTPATFQFTLDSGFANQTGQWSLNGADNPSPASTDGAATTDSTSSTQSTAEGQPDANAASNDPTDAGSAGACEEGACEMSQLPNQCSRGLASSETISCALASNVFYEYYEASQNASSPGTISAWSPVTSKYYQADCSAGDGLIDCAIEGASGSDPTVDVTQAALAAYTPGEATSYASNADLGPNG